MFLSYWSKLLCEIPQLLLNKKLQKFLLWSAEIATQNEIFSIIVWYVYYIYFCLLI